MSRNLYFLAIIPPQTIAEEVEVFRKMMAQRYHSKHALNAPPHITIIPPFWWEEENINDLLHDLQQWLANHAWFKVSLLNFNCFPPRVIFIDISENQELLRFETELKMHLVKKWSWAEGLHTTFRPHLTIAFKDLKPNYFHQAWDYLKNQTYQARFYVDHLYLLRSCNKKWNVVNGLKLNNHYPPLPSTN